MPSSVKDRFSNKWEYVFFFTKNKKYYFDLDAVRKPLSDPDRLKRAVSGNRLNSNDAKEAFFGNVPKGISKPRPNIKHDIAVNRIGSYSDPLHTKPYNSKGANPGDVFESKYISDMETETASPAGRVMRNLANGKTTTLVREAITNVNQYLKDKLKESGVSLKELSEISGEPETKIAHYFRTDESGCALPNKEFWDKVKDILNLEDYNKHVKEEYKSVMLTFNPLGANPGDVMETVEFFRQKGQGGNYDYGGINSEEAKHYNPLGANPGDVFNISTIPHKETHFAVYPETLVAPLIKAGCPKGGIVLDPFAGSGTTGVVAEILGRDSILIEISSDYCKIIEERLKPENIKKAQKILMKNGHDDAVSYNIRKIDEII